MESPSPERVASALDALDVRRVRQLVKLMDEHGLNEIDLRQGEIRIRLRRGIASAVPAPAAAPPGPAPISSPTAVSESISPQQPGTAEQDRFLEIKSPMVGTFYAASSPDAEPFVQVGSRVNPTTTVCVIEAMKVFNEVPAETSGTIVAVLTQNGETVEYGQPLFRVDPAT